MHRTNRRKEWLVIIGVAILLHLVLFLSIKPEFFAMFKKSLSGSAGGGEVPAAAALPDAIITLEIDIDESDGEPAEPPPRRAATAQHPAETPREKPVTRANENENRERPSEKTGAGKALEAVDLKNLIGQDPATLPYDATGSGEVKIPPRPLEITWPDTRKLKHCLGHQIDIRIQVDEDGRVLRVEPVEADHPSDCVRAALDSARRIVFEPGRVNGVPIRMWTQIRIDFRKKG